MRRPGYRSQGHIGHEAERALRPDHQVGEDLHGRVVVEEGIERVGHGLLARELGPDARGQRAVPAHLVAQGQERGVQVGTGAAEVVVRLGPRGVEHGAVREHEVERVQRVVAVLGDAAAHPGGVVGDDAADHAGVDGSGIGAQSARERRQHAVEVAAHDAGLAPETASLVEDPVVLPEGGELHQDVVGDGLPGERRPGRAQGQVPPVGAAVGEEGADLVEVARAHDDLRDHPVDRRVDGPRHAVDGPGEHALGREHGLEVAHEGAVALAHRSR